jgi:hypothetical protein
LAQTPVERGSYLVNGVLTCGNCHTPRGPGGAMGHLETAFRRPADLGQVTFKVKGANITPDPDTGIGKWSDAEIKRALVDGVRPNGTQMAPIMPYGSTRSSHLRISTPSWRISIGGGGPQRRRAAGLQGRVAR